MAGGANVVQAGELRSARIESLRALAALGVLSAHIHGRAHGFGRDAYTPYLHALRWYLLLVPLCLAAAFASYAVIEAPFLRLRRSWAAAAPEQQARGAALEPRPALEAAG